MNKPLVFKRGETMEITVLFEILDDYGISSLSGVRTAAQLRQRRSRSIVADFALSVYPEDLRVLLTLSAAECAELSEGRYTADIVFTRLSDGLTQYSGDIDIEIIKSTSHADKI